MSTTPSTKFAWSVPDPGTEGDAWGAELNTIFASIDSYLGVMAVDKQFSVKTDDYVPVALGSLTGAVSVDLDDGRFFSGTAVANFSFSLSNVPATGKVVYIMFEITNGGAYTVTWPASFAWPGGSPPTLTAAGVDVIAAYTRDGGTTWRAAAAQIDSQAPA